MHIRTALPAALLVLAGLAAIPASAAEVPLPTDIPYCVFEDCEPLPIVCEEKTYPLLSEWSNTLTTHEDCTMDLETGKDIICVGAWSATATHQVGPLTWTRHYCSFPGGDPLCCLTTASSARETNPCGTAAEMRCPAPYPLCSGIKDPYDPFVGVQADLSSNCHVSVRVDLINCLWGERDVTRTVGPLTVTYTECASPPTETTAAEQPPCTCPPPAPLCRPINQLIADNEDAVDYSLADTCRLAVEIDVTEVVDCIYGGDVRRTVGPVTVIYPSCSGPCGAAPCPPPMEVASMADPFPTCVRECSPIPNEGCELKAATPTTVGPLLLPFNPQAFVWGNDCDIDVDPIGACAPPSGHTIERDVLFLDIRILVCDGGIDPPAWS